MSIIRHLSAAPIVEALLDVRFDVDDSVDGSAEYVRPITERFADRYPWQVESNPAKYKLDLFGNKDASLLKTNVSIFNKECKEKSTREIVISRDGLTVRQIWEYSNWIDMEETLHEVMLSFIDIMKPSAIIRLSTRFFNKIQLPDGRFNLDDVFTCGPRVPSNVPQTLFDFRHRVGIIGTPPEMLAWIEHYLDLSSGPPACAILDIDVFRNQRFAASWSAIKDALNDMHSLKNELFFGSLTDSVIARYE